MKKLNLSEWKYDCMDLNRYDPNPVILGNFFENFEN